MFNIILEDIYKFILKICIFEIMTQTKEHSKNLKKELIEAY